MTRKRPQDQTIEEWLADYDSTPALKGANENGFKGPEEDDMHFKDTGGDIEFEPAPSGVHIGRCIRIIDLGTHHDQLYDKDKHEVFFMWEIPEEMKRYTIKGKDGQPDKDVVEPFTVSKFYTMSLSERAWLRKDLESWRGKGFTEDELQGFDPRAILDAPCMLNVIHEPKKKGSGVNAVVSAITPMPKGIECKPRSHDLVFFSLENFDQTIFDGISKGLQAKIKNSKEYQARMAAMGQVPGQQQPVQQQPAQGAQQAPPQQEQPPVDDYDDIPF